MMNRRRLLVSLALAPCSASIAQQRAALPVIGFLNSGSPGPYRAQVNSFLEGLADQGLIADRNFTIHYAWAESQPQRLPGLMDAMLQRNVDVIVTTGGDVVLHTARAASRTMPIVSTIGADPVAAGYVASLSKPGGNITGVSFLTVELTAKRLELLLQVKPDAKRLLLLTNSASPQTPAVVAAAQTIAQERKVEMLQLEAQSAREIDEALHDTIVKTGDVLLVQADPFFNNQRIQLAEKTIHRRLPAIHESRAFTSSGGLMSYGADLLTVYRAVGHLAAKVIKGARPAELPVEQPTKFEFAVNLETARKIGLELPTALIARADEVIE